MQRYIYIRSTETIIPCTEEEFQEYYRGISAFRRKEQRHGRCVCPSNRSLCCDIVCGHCPYVREGDMLSLDNTVKFVSETEEFEYSHLENTAEESQYFDEILIEAEALRMVLKRIEELMPMAILIGKLRVAGYTETEIERMIHINRRTYAYRLKKPRLTIEKEFSEIMQDFFQTEH